MAATQAFQKDYISTLFSAVRAYYGLGGKPLQPARMQAVYLPAWVIDAHASAKVWLSKRGDENVKQETLEVYFQRSYMPGFSMDPLSQMSFSDIVESDEQLKGSLPFGEELMKQHGTDILCLPYTAAPFALPEAARGLSFNDAIIEEDFRFDPPTLRSDLIAAYPVLIPVYIMQYNAQPYPDREGYSFTVVVEASRQQGVLISENVLPLTSSYFKGSFGSSWFELPEDIAREPFMRVLPLNSSMHEPFARPTFFSQPKPRESWGEQLIEWVDAHARAPGAMARYTALQHALGQHVDFDDLRVRDAAEAPAFADYLVAVQNVWYWRDTLQRLAQIDERSKKGDVEVRVLGFGGPERTSSSMDTILETIQKSLKKAEAQLEKEKPAWLHEWEARQKTSDSEDS